MELSQKENRAITWWLLLVVVLIMFMVSLGGFVRLAEAGLSIVEWNPVSGAVPPVGEAAWQAEFEKYQATPEYQFINQGMTLEAYQRIFVIEYVHRLLARVAGLFVALPLLFFLLKGIIPWRRSAVYVAIALLFAFQGFLGWYMVSSGLRDIPAVSPYRLAIHLLMALFLLGLTLWMTLNHYYGFPERQAQRRRSAPYLLSLAMLVILVLQIGYGALMAGMDAGHVSNSFPLIFGRLIPTGLFSQLQPWWHNLLASTLTVHFIHRWLAFAVLGAAIVLAAGGRRRGQSQAIQRSLLAIVLLVCLQILLGISVIWLRVPLSLALLHQFVAMLIFVFVVVANFGLTHRLSHRKNEPAMAGESVGQLAGN